MAEIREVRGERMGNVDDALLAAHKRGVAASDAYWAERVELLEQAVRNSAHAYHDSFHLYENGEDFTDCNEKECLAACKALGIDPLHDC